MFPKWRVMQDPVRISQQEKWWTGDKKEGPGAEIPVNEMNVKFM